MSSIEAAASAVLSASLLAMPNVSQDPKTSVRETVLLSGTVERIDRPMRTLTVRIGPSTTQTVHVPSDVKLFDELKTGDKITARIIESVVVAVRPGMKPSLPVDTTASAPAPDASGRKAVLQQLTAAVTVESVDRSQKLIVYKTADNQRAIRSVIDPRLLEGLKPGDVIEITYAVERAIDLQRAR